MLIVDVVHQWWWKGRGPDVGGVCLRKPTDSSQDRLRRTLPTRRSVHIVKALRSSIELAIAHRTTSADSKNDIVTSLQVRKSGDILPFCVHADRRRCRDGVTAAFRSMT